MPEPVVLVVNITFARRQGSVTVLYGTTEDGSPVLVAADARIAAAVAERLAAQEGPVPVTVELWQIMVGGSEV